MGRPRLTSEDGGQVQAKRLPFSRLSTRISPSCSCMIFWLTGSPSPVPRLPLRDSKTEKILFMVVGFDALAIVFDITSRVGSAA